MYVYDPATRLCACALKGKESMMFLLLGDVEEVLGDYATQYDNMGHYITALFRIKEVFRDDDFLDKAASTSSGMEIFKGDVWNSRTKIVEPFSPEFVFSSTLIFPYLLVTTSTPLSPMARRRRAL